MPSRPVILDTNFLLIPYQFKINIIREIDFLLEVAHHYVISSRTIDELEKIGKSQGKNGIAARLALKMVESNPDKIKVVESDGNVDNWIVGYSKENNAIVCTNDIGLRRRLKPHNIKVVVLKSKSKLGYA